MYKRIVFSLLIVNVAAWVAGCQTMPAKVSTGSTALAEPLVWPGAPATARIRFVGSVARAQDFGIRPSLWDRLGNIFFGNENWHMVRPTGVAMQSGILYVADPGAGAIWILDPARRRVLAVRQAGERRLVSPVAITIGGADQIYAADSYLAVVLRFNSHGRISMTISHPEIKRPCAIAYDVARDRLYVADSVAHRVWVLNAKGVMQGVIGQRGTADGEFNFPTHIALDREGMLYVTDSLNFRVQFFSPDGRFAGKFGRHGDTSGDFAMPKGIAVDDDGHIYVAETLFDAIQIFDREGHYLLSFGQQGTKPGEFWLPNGLWIDPMNRIYVADSYNQRIQIFDYVANQSNP